MLSISLCTARCIVTGRPAAVWSGHLKAKGYGPIREDGRMPLLEVSVMAGFADSETCLAAASDKHGCFGEWQDSHGLLLHTQGHDHIVAKVADGDFLSIKRSLFAEQIKGRLPAAQTG